MAPAEIRTNLERAVVDLRGAVLALRVIHGRMARPGGQDENTEEALIKGLEERDLLCLQLGRLVADWLDNDGTIEVKTTWEEEETSFEGVATSTLCEILEPRPAPFAAPPASTPPEPVAAPLPPPGPPPTKQSLKELQNRFKDRDPPDRESDQGRLQRILSSLKGPTKVAGLEGYMKELEGLRGQIERLDDWVPLPARIQKILLEHVGARIRHLQDEAASHAFQPPEFGQLFRALSQFSGEHRPGTAHGLARSHAPRNGRWHRDAMESWTQLRDEAGLTGSQEEETSNPERSLNALGEWLDAPHTAEELAEEVPDRFMTALATGLRPDDPRLVKLAAPHLDLLEGSSLKALRRAVRSWQAQPADEDQEPDNGNGAVPPDWPLFFHTGGRVAVVVGGDPRQEALDKIREAFQFSDAEWVTPDRNAIEALTARVRPGNNLFVVLLQQFRPHAADQKLIPALKETGTPWVNVTHGYGVSQVKLAIERFMGRSAPAA